MNASTTDVLRHQLEDRRRRLTQAITQDGTETELVFLLQQVDRALSTLGTDDYALCLVCEGHCEDADLRHNPLLQYCLCDLSAEQTKALEHDLELAHRIQSALLPDPDLSAAGWEAHYRYEPAGVVSGDYCDLWQRPDEPDAVYFALGDVSGKGVAASLLMSHLQASFRSLIDSGVPMAELVGRINRQLLKATLPSHYATLVAGRAAADGTVELVNAGHCPPLVVRAGEVRAIAATGFPLGLVEDRPYGVQRIQLGADDALVLYSDGLTEARAANGDEYGQERIERLLGLQSEGTPARRLVQAMRSDLGGFLAETPRGDDLTVLALRRNGEAD